MSAKFPKCQGIVSVIRGEPIEIKMQSGVSMRGVSYACQHCASILRRDVLGNVLARIIEGNRRKYRQIRGRLTARTTIS